MEREHFRVEARSRSLKPRATEYHNGIAAIIATLKVMIIVIIIMIVIGQVKALSPDGDGMKVSLVA